MKPTRMNHGLMVDVFLIVQSVAAATSLLFGMLVWSAPDTIVMAESQFLDRIVPINTLLTITNLGLAVVSLIVTRKLRSLPLSRLRWALALLIWAALSCIAWFSIPIMHNVTLK